MTAENIKKALWQAMHDVKNGVITTQQGDSIARHAREIVRVHACQLETLREMAVATEPMKDFVQPEVASK